MARFEMGGAELASMAERQPTGEGLFSVRSVDEAAGALDAIQSEPARHQKAARALAVEYLDTNRVLGRFLTEVGIH